MENLYNELWRKNLENIIEDHSFAIYRPQHPGRPGYKIELKATGEDTILVPGTKFSKIEKVFKVLKIESKLPCGINRLLVRPEFEATESALTKVELDKWTDVDLETGLPANYVKLDFSIGGQPGSGKSFFLCYLLVRRINAGLPTAFRISDSRCYLFTDKYHGTKTDAETLFDIAEDEKRHLWILTDEVIEDPGWFQRQHSWFLVLAATPGKVAKSRQWVKERKPGKHFMTNWEWDEIVAAFRIQKSKPIIPNEILMLFTLFTSFGPIARTCLKTISTKNAKDYDEDLSGYIGEIDKEIVTYIKADGFQAIDNTVDQSASHRIMIMVPTDDRQSYEPEILTRWIALRVFEQAQKKSKLRCYELYQQLSGQGRLRSAAGWFFELYAHEWLNNGGLFNAEKPRVDGMHSSTLRFKTSTSKAFNHFKDAKDLLTKVVVTNGRTSSISKEVIGRYFLPRAANFESVDGLVFSSLHSLIVFQITIARSHEVKLHGLKQLCEALPATIKNMDIVFVIPEDLISEYSKVQKVPSPIAVRPKVKGFTLNQFRLVLREDQIVSMALDGPFHRQAGGAGGGGKQVIHNDHNGEDTAIGGTE